MAKTAHSLLTGLAFIVTLFVAGQTQAAEDESMALVLHVDNYARIPDTNLVRAEAAAGAIYRAVGINVTWVNDDVQPIIPVDGRRHLRVLLLCSAMTNTKADADRIPDNVMGQAAHGASRAYVFTYRVRNVALQHSRSFDMMLGRVIAHEVGHLLLQPGSHSKTGIMREFLDVHAFGSERFTIEQGDELRLAVNR